MLALCREYSNFDDEVITTNQTPKRYATNDNSTEQSSKFAQRYKPKTKVLLVDDEPVCHIIISLFLMNSNYELIEVNNGIEALNYLQSDEGKEIGLILLDLMLPDISGKTLLTKIKQDDSLANIPVIIQTAIHDELEIQRCLKVGALSFLRKPFDKIDLIEQMNVALGL